MILTIKFSVRDKRNIVEQQERPFLHDNRSGLHQRAVLPILETDDNTQRAPRKLYMYRVRPDRKIFCYR